MRLAVPFQAVLLAVAALLAAAGPALAGTPGDPEAPDPAGDARLPDPCQDIVGAWVEADAEGALAFTMAVAACSAPPTLVAEPYWGIGFHAQGEAWFWHALWNPAQAACEHWHGQASPDGSTEHRLGRCDLRPGTPALLVVEFPPDLLRLAPGDAVELTRVHAGMVDGNVAALETDHAEPVRAFVQPAPPGPATVSPPSEAVREPAPGPPGGAPSGSDAPGASGPLPAPPSDRAAPWPGVHAIGVILGLARALRRG